MKTPHVTCIVPTLNEGITIAEVITKSKQYVDQVIVIDGYSTDGTIATAKQLGADVMLQERRGKGRALRTVFAHNHADIFVTIDGDATYDAHEMDRLLSPILSGEADMVIGSRFLGPREPGAISTMNLLGNHLFNFLVNLLTRGKITDSQSGYRALSHRALAAMKLSSEGFDIETEITMQAVRRGLRIREVGITYRQRRGTPSKLRVFADGLRIMKTIFVELASLQSD